MEQSSAKGKRSLGRRKIEIRKIEKKDARKVCFSKRRQGLMKKAADLSILCGAEIAVIIFSPGGKPYTFGSVSTLHRFLNHTFSGASTSTSVTSTRDENSDDAMMIRTLNEEHGEILRQIETERKRNATLTKMLQDQKAAESQPNPIAFATGLREEDVNEYLDETQFCQSQKGLEEFRSTVLKPAEEITLMPETPVVPPLIEWDPSEFLSSEFELPADSSSFMTDLGFIDSRSLLPSELPNIDGFLANGHIYGPCGQLLSIFDRPSGRRKYERCRKLFL